MRALGNTRSLSWLLGAMLWAAGCAVAQSQVAIPPLDSPVVDLTDTLSTQDRQRLEARARELRSRSGAQLQILIVPTTAPEDVAAYAQRVFDTQGLGRKGVDDGLLILVAKNDRRTRIHTGTGLEAKIPDATAKRLIDEYLVPKFRRGDFAGGLDDATSVLARLMNGEPLPEPTRQEKREDMPPTTFVLFLSAIAALAAHALPKRFGTHARIGLGAVVAGLAGFAMSSHFGIALMAAIAGVLATVGASRIVPSAPASALTRAPSDPGRQWSPDEFTFDPNDPEVLRRRQERERREPEAARDNDTDWGGGGSSGGWSDGGGGSRGGGASGGW